MRLCAGCGVELEENMNFCPLCGEPVIDDSVENVEHIVVRKRIQEEKPLTDYQKLSSLQKRKLFWQLSGIILFSGMVVTFFIDLLRDEKISWSRYPIAACVTVFVYLTLFSFWSKRTLLLLIGSFISTSALLILLDVFDGDIDWGVKLGVPLLLTTYLIMITLVWTIRNAKEKSLNLIAYSLAAAVLLSISVEGIISLYMDAVLKLYWSLVVLASVLPILALLLFGHHRLKKGADWKRFFHI